MENIGSGLIFVAVTFVLWLLKIDFLGFKFYPFGFTFTFLNPFYRWSARKISGVPESILNWVLLLQSALVPFVLLSLPVAIIQYEILRNIFSTVLEGDELLLVVFCSFLVHEMFHGIAAELEKIGAKSTGVLLIPYLVGAAYVNLNVGKWLQVGTHQTSNSGIPTIFRGWTDEMIRSYGRTISAGGLGNLVLIILSLFFNSPFFGSLLFVNVFLLYTNLLPIVLTDGHKLKMYFISTIKTPWVQKTYSFLTSWQMLTALFLGPLAIIWA